MRVSVVQDGRRFEVEYNAAGKVWCVSHWIKGRFGVGDHTRCLWSEHSSKPQSALVLGAIKLAEERRANPTSAAQEPK